MIRLPSQNIRLAAFLASLVAFVVLAVAAYASGSGRWEWAAFGTLAVSSVLAWGLEGESTKDKENGK